MCLVLREDSCRALGEVSRRTSIEQTWRNILAQLARKKNQKEVYSPFSFGGQQWVFVQPLQDQILQLIATCCWNFHRAIWVLDHSELILRPEDAQAFGPMAHSFKLVPMVQWFFKS